MSSIDAVIAQVKSDLSKYDESGLINDDAMYREIVLAMKSFGNDASELQETMLTVENYEAQLPKGFFTLHLAALCDPIAYWQDKENKHVQESQIFTERTEYNRKWNECENCCEDFETKTIVENVYIKGRESAKFYYGNPRILKLGRSFRRDRCVRNSANIHNPECDNEINITGSTLQTNFKEGSIYFRYYGLALDEEGELEIPDTANGNLDMYLEYRLKAKISEMLIAGGDAQHLTQLYPTYVQQANLYRRKTSNELKMKSLTPKNISKLIIRNRQESLKFESPYKV